MRARSYLRLFIDLNANALKTKTLEDEMEPLTKDELVLMVSVLVSDVSTQEGHLKRLKEMPEGSELRQCHVSDIENRITRRNQLLSRVIKLLAEEAERWPKGT